MVEAKVLVGTKIGYTTYEIVKDDHLKGKERVERIGTYAHSLSAARRILQASAEDPRVNRARHTERVLKVTPQLLELFGDMWPFQAIQTRQTQKHYIVFERMDKEEVDWCKGIYPTLKAAKDRGGHTIAIAFSKGRRIEVDLDQPPPASDDVWGLEL